MMRVLNVLLLILALVYSNFALAKEAQSDKQRLVVLTDIEADPDDTQSLIRLLLYANQIDIEGLVATTSIHQPHRNAPGSIRKVLAAYAVVEPNLQQHEKGFPTAKTLSALVKSGQPGYGMKSVGDNLNSEGSDWLVQLIKKPDNRPLWVSVWGGANTLAQALYTLQLSSNKAELSELLAKLRVYSISDQDDSGYWIRTNFPDVFYIVSPGGYGAATWLGINEVVQDFDNTSISNEWLSANIQQKHGPLGAAYPDVAYGMEGDTPAFLALIPNGLNHPERPDWGSWGGRYQLYIPELKKTDPNGFNGGVPVEQERRPIWTNAVDLFYPSTSGEFGRRDRNGKQSFAGFKTTVWRWRDDFQHDFAARMDWTILTYAEANHPPRVELTHAAELEAKAGQRLILDASASTDPDGDSLSYFWFVYPEAGTAKAKVTIDTENLARIFVNISDVEKEGFVHLIVRVTDKGQPALARYQRVVINIKA